jgi:3-deoxy-D-manno-octulosonate 8-phosphate phosphatase (KDO 8-P phosphatase)
MTAAVAPLSPELATKIRLVVLDVDGVLSDGAIYVGALPDGESVELKRFHIQDGIGVRLLQEAGLQVAVVSGRVSRATEIRARELGIEECHQNAGAQKVPVIRDLHRRLGLGWEETAMLGDDLPDMAVLKKVGLPAVVADATSEVRRVALWQSSRPGGHGAVREFCEALLRARDQWEELVRSYVKEREGDDRG